MCGGCSKTVCQHAKNKIKCNKISGVKAAVQGATSAALKQAKQRRQTGEESQHNAHVHQVVHETHHTCTKWFMKLSWGKKERNEEKHSLYRWKRGADMGWPRLQQFQVEERRRYGVTQAPAVPGRVGKSSVGRQGRVDHCTCPYLAWVLVLQVGSQGGEVALAHMPNSLTQSLSRLFSNSHACLA